MTYLNVRIPGSNSRHEIGNSSDPYANLSAYVTFEEDSNTLRFFGSDYLSVDMDAGASGNTVYGGVGRLSVYDEGTANRFVGKDADNYAYLQGVGALVTFRDGNNGLTDYGMKTNFKLGDGDNNLWLNGQKGAGVVGDGDNEITFVEQSLSYKLTLGDGNNMVDLNGKSSKITAGDGNNQFIFGEESQGNTVMAGDGDNTFDLRGSSHTVIAGGEVYASVASSNTKVTLGNGDYAVFATGRNFTFAAGTGHGYISLGAPGAKVNVAGTATVWGSASSDTIVAKGNGTYDGPRTYVNAGAGNDTINAGDYAEAVGGSGADNIKVGKNAIVKGGAGNDSLTFIGGQVMGGSDADTFIPKAASGYAWTDFNGKGLSHDVLDLSKLVSAMDTNSFMGVGVYGDTLEIQITIGGKLVNISLGNVGDDVAKAGGFFEAASAGIIISAPDVIKPLMYDERG